MDCREGNAVFVERTEDIAVARPLRSSPGWLAFTALWIALWLPDESLAQTFPSECQPEGGALCVAKRPSPFTYYSRTWENAILTDAERPAALHAHSVNYPDTAGCPPNEMTWLGWANGQSFPADFSIHGYPEYQGPWPVLQAGYDVQNYSLYDVMRYVSAPQCDTQTVRVGYVERNGPLKCLAGYTSVGSAYCKREGLARDTGKNLGPACEVQGQCAAGNPINVGVGNKYQAERDFVGSGPHPLRFERFYNSHASHSVNGLYRFSNTVSDNLRVTMNPENDASIRVIGADAMGAGWRHTYQRVVAEFGRDSVRSVALYRQDGKVLNFTYYGGQWVTEADINFKLVEVTSGGSTTGWEVTTPDDELETYDAQGRLLTIANRAGVTVTLAYDSLDRLDTVTDAFGRQLDIGYAADLQPGSEWWEDATVNHQVKTVTDPLGNTYTFGYDSSGNLTSVTYPDLIQRQYRYEDPSYPFALTGIVDGNGTQYATFGYDAEGRANLSYHGQGGETAERVDVVYTKTHSAHAYNSVQSAAVTFAQGSLEQVSRSTGFDVELGVAKMQTMSQGADTESRTYDSAGNVERHTDLNGVTTYREYNARNLEELRREAEGSVLLVRTVTTTWHPTYRLPDVVTEPQRTIDYDYYPNGDLERVTITSTNSPASEDPSTDGNRNRIWNYTYNAFGQVTSINGPRVDVTDVTTIGHYDSPACPVGNGECGQMAYVIDAAGNRVDFNEYYADGRLKKMTDANGLVTEYEYDSRRRMKKVTHSDGVSFRVTQYVYDNAGLLDLVTFPDGLALDYEWTTAHLLDYVEDNAGNRVDYAYDARGQRVAEDFKDPSGTLRRAMASTFDSFGFIDTLTVGTSTTDYDFDPLGNLEQVRDANQNATQYVIDALGRIDLATDALLHDTDYGYDSQNNVTGVTAVNGAVTVFEYDGLGNLDNEDSADRGFTDLDYDDAGNLRYRTDARNVTVEMQYDSLNRMTEIIHPDPSLNASFDYDDLTGNAKGRLRQVQDQTGSTVYTYTKFGEVDVETVTVNGVAVQPEVFVLDYDYNGSGTIDKIVMPDGRIIDYFFDAQGRVSELRTTFNGSTTTLVNSILYEPFGPMKSWAYGNGLVQTTGYDLQYMPGSMTVGALFNVAYDLDAGDVNIASITDNVPGGLDWTQGFGYDELDRLGHEDGTTGYKDYEYDENGNREYIRDSQQVILQQLTYEPNSNRIASRNQTYSMVLDAAGNTLDDGNAIYGFAYDDRGRLEAAYFYGSEKETYRYNGAGQRAVKITDPGLATQFSRAFIYGQNGELIFESKFMPNGVRVNHAYVWLNGAPVAMIRTRYGATGKVLWDEVLTYLHPDHLGTPRLGTKSGSQTVSWHWQSDAFGKGWDNADPDGNGAGVYVMLRLPGQYFDGPTGKHYNYFRTYDPSTGRYLESDPIGLSGGLNTYGYAGANPLLFSDSTGLFLDETGQFLKMCVQKAPVVAASTISVAASGIALLVTPSSTAQCDVVQPNENCPGDDDCARLYAKIDAAVKDLKRRYWEYLADPKGLPEAGPFSRQGHRDQFEGRQKNLRGLIEEAITRGCLAYDPEAWTWATRELLEIPPRLREQSRGGMP